MDGVRVPRVVGKGPHATDEAACCQPLIAITSVSESHDPHEISEASTRRAPKPAPRSPPPTRRAPIPHPAPRSYGFPFDRHDWFVDRNGREVRYIIDYYYNPSPSVPVPAVAGPAPSNYLEAPPVDPERPRLTGNILVDVRPAVDDLTSALDRLRLFPARALAALRGPHFRAEGLDPATMPREAAALGILQSHGGGEVPRGEAKQPSAAAAGPAPPAAPPAAPHPDPEVAAVSERCRPHLIALRDAGSDEARRTAHVALTYCMATRLCAPTAAEYMRELEAGDASPPGAEEAAFHAMSNCVVARMKGGGSRGAPLA